MQPYSGLVDLSNLPKSSIEKITVSKGMPSLAYGSNSYGRHHKIYYKK
ncbi:MAG: hypothetical protein U5K00_24540 [Melioribacteraceae bacterium]|nr:hypothetical protein [Melioribacteraceae bacterium]